MKLVLSVEGKEFEVISASFREGKVCSAVVIDEEGRGQCFHDFSHQPDEILDSTAIDMEKAFSTENEHADLIRKRIDALEERMIELAMEYIQHEGPFAEKCDLQKDWYQLNEQIKGLWQALEIVEGKHKEGTVERFIQGIVKAAATLLRGTDGTHKLKTR